MDKTRLTFRKEERLKSTKAIASLFQDGHTTFVYPIKIVWKQYDNGATTPLQAAFSVSSKIFKKSTDRNLLKRRMREAFRLHKNEFLMGLAENKIILMLIYIGKEETDYAGIEKSVMAGMKRIIGKLRYL